MPHLRTLSLIALLASLAACADQSTSPTDLTGPMQAAKPGPGDPTATWAFPANETGLGFASDGQGAYANGTCVATVIFATTAGSNSGDATIQTAKSRTCTRRFTLRYSAAAGDTESVPSFNNLLGLQSTTSIIHVGAPAMRRLIINPGAISNNPSRCGRVIFGANGTVGAGSDSVLVTRVDASTWQVQSTGNQRGWCETTGALYTMPVSFTVASSYALPL
jgi:hypothetical protein